MRRFKWIEWNIQKIANHALSADEVEASFDRVIKIEDRRDGSYKMTAEVPSGRRVTVIWRHDREADEEFSLFDDLDDPPIFVITAY